MSAQFDGHEIRRALGLPGSSQRVRFGSVSTDTRQLKKGALFVALSGDRFDGFDYLERAARKGALGAVVQEGRELPPLDLEWFQVPDTTRALGDLARLYRRRCAARVVGVTGSSGKTTVKEMLACAIGGERRVHATEGNFNNLIGVPLTVLAAPPDAEVWVLEMGSNAPGEIARLAAIAEPDDALITTIGPAHLEGFGDESGVLREKLALVRAARPAGSVVVGEKPSLLGRSAREIRADARVAGLDDDADWRPDRWGIDATTCWFERGGTRYVVPAGGEHHLRDAILAAAMAEAIGVSSAGVSGGIAQYRPVGMRGALRQLGELTIVADCYNANPESFAAAIDYCVKAFPGRRLAAVVGSMLELGAHSNLAHEEVARSLVEAGFAQVVALGDFGPAFERLSAAANGTRVERASSAASAVEAIAARLTGDEVILVKASRGERLERVIEGLEARFGEGS
ncbi:MAG: UDP-N-acetylmuramoyl-tripeptide--D-alanyl-D-alanine ligase [marine benthic group bacterium]|nr:UDP-N-acetylmuramoyl-tripeptide--D-alanyl-D-alanine ligase [Gemmatimonadota bacterium]